MAPLHERRRLAPPSFCYITTSLAIPPATELIEKFAGIRVAMRERCQHPLGAHPVDDTPHFAPRELWKIHE
ncbi:MAG: hypothetical protein ACXWP0_01075 [Ktedonobacterales bacterium]